MRKSLPWKSTPAKAKGPSIERLAADLRRLGREAVRLQTDTHVYARVFKLRALSRAYDDTLLIACQVLEVDIGDVHSPLDNVQRLDVEIELSRRGLTW